MELKELTNKTLEIFGVDNVGLLGLALLNTVTNNDTAKYQAFIELVGGDLNKDWLQMIYQYYLADREGLKQDYTPQCLAGLLAQYAVQNTANEIVDLCAGSAALTIAQWTANKNITVDCQELDSNVIPYLLFNLAVRNIAGIVKQKNILCDETLAEYIFKRGEQFATVHKQSTI